MCYHGTVHRRIRQAFLASLLLLAVDTVTAGISLVDTLYVSARQQATAPISVPSQTKPGDMMVIFIGGSGRPYKDSEPSGPTPEAGWTEIIRFGPKDINQ